MANEFGNDNSLEVGSKTQYNKLKDDFINTEELTVYPNPANSVLQLKIPENFKAPVIRIFDENGKLVITEECEFSRKNNTKIEININDLNNGIYFIVLQNENQTRNSKFIVSNH